MFNFALASIIPKLLYSLQICEPACQLCGDGQALEEQ